MMKENQIMELIEWGKEENQQDFVDFVNFCRERRADQKTVIVEMDGEIRELPVEKYEFWYKKPFQDFDFCIIYNKFKDMVDLPYTGMKLITKIGDNSFQIKTENDKSAVIRLKEGQ